MKQKRGDKFRDAFGNKLIIGQMYAYVRGHNGYVSSLFGELSHVTERGYANILVEKRYKGIYADPVKPDSINMKKAHIKANQLVPYNTHSNTEEIDE